MRHWKTLSILVAASHFVLPVAVYASGADGYYVQEHQSHVLGAPVGGRVTAGNPEATQTVQTTADVTLLGKSLSALSAQVEPSANWNGVTYTEVYSFGKRVFSDAFFLKSDGYNQIRAGLTPTEVRVPFVIYPVGPLTLEVGGGVRFQAEVKAMLTPEIGFPAETSTLGVQIMALAQAAGFVEAYAKLLILRGGVGGQIDLIDGHLDVNGRVQFDGTKPIMLVSGIVHFLKGRVYAFLDLFGIFTFGWNRLIDHQLYGWYGYCYSMGNISCPVKRN